MSYPSRRKPPCRLFNTPAGCRFGSNCKFSHPSGHTSSTPQQPVNHGASTRTNSFSPNAISFAQWERTIPQATDAPPLGARLSWFFTTAETLLKQDNETLQSVVARLATEGGLARIGEIALQIHDLPDDQQTAKGRSDIVFNRCLMPVLRLLSHRSVISSCLLEEPVELMLTFIHGPAGRRANTLFNFAASQLEDDDPLRTTERTEDDLEACVVILARILDLQTSATVNPEFNPIAEPFHSVFKELLDIDEDLIRSRTSKSLERIGRRLGIGALITETTAKANQQKNNHDKPVFELAQDAPGALSPGGQRHDNDHLDVKDIGILPTASELKAQRQDFLPVTAYSPHCENNMQGLLDRQFRLLREDTVGLLREGVKLEYEQRKNGQHSAYRDQQAARTFAYHDASLQQFTVDRTTGVNLEYEFSQPQAVQAYTDVSKRKDWWFHSKRLQHGALVCLIDPRGRPLFCTVTDNGLAGQDSRATARKSKTPAIFEHPERAYITLTLVEISHTSLDNLLDGYIRSHQRGSEVLVEFPGVILPAFRPTLEALRHMSCRPQYIPFSDLIAPQFEGQTSLIDVQAPDYALKAGFAFDLSCLTRGEEALNLSPRQPFDLQALKRLTTLDNAQAESLKYALTHKVALIQGPPGTGKSYTGVAIIKALVSNAKLARLGPLICVTYTNHALDQILEHVHAAGVKKIIRIGSQSKSEILEKLNLREVVTNMQSTRLERRRHYQAKTALEAATKQLNESFHAFIIATFPTSVFTHLQAQHPMHCQQIFSQEQIDDEGFQVVGPHVKNPLEGWLLSGEPASESQMRPVEHLENINAFALNRAERRYLYFHWIREIREGIKVDIKATLVTFQNAKNEMDKVRQEQELRCLGQAEVIGMTTSGLARIISQLQHLNAKVLLMEEAGEVLEAHTLVTMLPSIEHAVLIGDHQQLRPQAQNYDLSVESPIGRQHAFDVSLFERLVAPIDSAAPFLPKRTLLTQRRMHPSISNLVRSTLYPDLEDGPNVEDYPQISGMRKRLFWFDHQQPEIQKGDDVTATSHSNKFEVEMTVALVSHLINQGCYESRDVAILTPYLGQLRRLRAALSSIFAVVLSDRDADDLEKDDQALGRVDDQHMNGAITTTKRVVLSKALRIATVDNFQGEEAKCVVISLVRSNKERRCGFLRTTNRINVLLSRAQHGMYLIGNSDTYSTVPMWNDVVNMLKREDNFGNTLELCCPRHPNTDQHVKTPDDFATLAPEGGCSLHCYDRLGCGHACPAKCHSAALHEAVHCVERCSRALETCDVHPCPRPCGDPCPQRCQVVIPDVKLPCGHSQGIPCWETKDLDNAKCRHRVEWSFDECKHTVVVPCWTTKDRGGIHCTAKCGSILPCGHECKRPCGTCHFDQDGTIKNKPDHGVCQQRCNRPFTTCQHYCRAACHGDESCGLCEAACESRCSHSKCSKKCSEPCVPCAEEHCASSCPHSQCSMPCGAPCDWLPCDKRCEKLLGCGHQCPSLCGEQCPPKKFCQQCCSDEVKDEIVDWITFETYKSINLDEEPCVFPRCGHLQTRSSMDGVLDMQSHYQTNTSGQIIAVKSDSQPFSVELKRCSKCRGPLRDISRYGRITRRALLDESTKRLFIVAQQQYTRLQEDAFETEEALCKVHDQRPIDAVVQLRGSRNDQFDFIANLSTWSREHRQAVRLRRRALAFVQTTKKDEQPFYRVKAMVDNVSRRRSQQAMAPLIGTVQMRHYLLGAALLLHLDLALLSSVISLKRSSISAQAFAQDKDFEDCIVDLSTNRKDCEELAALAQEGFQPRQEAEGHLLLARYAALESSAAHCSRGRKPNAGQQNRIPSVNDLRQIGLRHLDQALIVCEANKGSTRGMQQDIDSARKMLESEFYAEVSNEERRAVLAAMSTEFRATGHWYTCANGHPFTIGECGGPMERARCPQCHVEIGGERHVRAEGVERAANLEREAAELEQTLRRTHIG